MVKPSLDEARQSETPSLLNSVADLLESSMLGIFGAAKETSTAHPRPPSADTHCEQIDEERCNIPPEETAPVSAQLSKQASESLSDDMPGLERLGRSICPASSDDEIRASEIELLPAAAIRSSRGSAVRARGSERRRAPTTNENISSSESELDKSNRRRRMKTGRRPVSGGRTSARKTPAQVAQRWVKPTFNTSSASTLVAGMSPAPTTGGASEANSWAFLRDDAPNPASKEAGHRLKYFTGPRVSNGGRTKESILPAPLDLASIPGPTRPRPGSRAAPVKAVVLPGAALKQMEQVRRRGSSTSVEESQVLDVGGDKRNIPTKSLPAPVDFRSEQEDEDTSDIPPPLASPKLTGHLRSPAPDDPRRQGRTRNGGYRGRGSRPSAWAEPSTEQVQGRRTGDAPPNDTQMRLILSKKAEDTKHKTVSPEGQRLDLLSSGSSISQANDAARPQLKVQNKKLAEVAADIALRGAISNAELVPGLGRSAFEKVSTSPTVPVRELATASIGTSSVGSHNGDASHRRKLSTGMQLDKLLEDSDRWLGGSSRDSRDAMLQRSRSSADERLASSGSYNAPSLTLVHAPGQVNRPVRRKPRQRSKGGHSVAALQAPFRLASSQLLTSFETHSFKSSGSLRSELSRAGDTDLSRKEGGFAEMAKVSPPPHVITSRRPTMLDVLSSFGSHSRSNDPDSRGRLGKHSQFATTQSHVDHEWDKIRHRSSSNGSRNSRGERRSSSRRRSHSSSSDIRSKTSRRSGVGDEMRDRGTEHQKRSSSHRSHTKGHRERRKRRSRSRSGGSQRSASETSSNHGSDRRSSSGHHSRVGSRGRSGYRRNTSGGRNGDFASTPGSIMGTGIHAGARHDSLNESRRRSTDMKSSRRREKIDEEWRRMQEVWEARRRHKNRRKERKEGKESKESLASSHKNSSREGREKQRSKDAGHGLRVDTRQHSRSSTEGRKATPVAPRYGSGLLGRAVTKGELATFDVSESGEVIDRKRSGTKTRESSVSLNLPGRSPHAGLKKKSKFLGLSHFWKVKKRTDGSASAPVSLTSPIRRHVVASTSALSPEPSMRSGARNVASEAFIAGRQSDSAATGGNTPKGRSVRRPFKGFLKMFTRKKDKEVQGSASGNSKTPRSSGQTAGSSGAVSDSGRERGKSLLSLHESQPSPMSEHPLGTGAQSQLGCTSSQSHYGSVGGQCLSQLYESPASSIMGCGAEGVMLGWDQGEAHDGGLRVQHLLRTSQLHAPHKTKSSVPVLSDTSSDLSTRFSSGDTTRKSGWDRSHSINKKGTVHGQ